MNKIVGFAWRNRRKWVLEYLPDFVFVGEQHYACCLRHSTRHISKERDAMKHHITPIHLLEGWEGATLPWMSWYCGIRWFWKRIWKVWNSICHTSYGYHTEYLQLWWVWRDTRVPTCSYECNLPQYVALVHLHMKKIRRLSSRVYKPTNSTIWNITR
jgi:hypothetical protein